MNTCALVSRMISQRRGLNILGPWACALLIWAASSSVWAASDNEVKAVFLYHFANFISWPDGTFAALDSPLRYCVLGTSEITPALSKVIEGEQAQGRPLVLSQPSQGASLADCHIVFIDIRAGRSA